MNQMNQRCRELRVRGACQAGVGNLRAFCSPGAGLLTPVTLRIHFFHRGSRKRLSASPHRLRKALRIADQVWEVLEAGSQARVGPALVFIRMHSNSGG